MRSTRPSRLMRRANLERRPASCGDSRVPFNVLRRRFTGVDAFTPEELERRLRGAGFDDVERHHTGRVWQIMRGVKQGQSEVDESSDPTN